MGDDAAISMAVVRFQNQQLMNQKILITSDERIHTNVVQCRQRIGQQQNIIENWWKLWSSARQR
jgi:hypothetical protein